MNSPIWFGQQQAINYFNLQPSAVKGQVNSATEYYKRQLYNKAFSVFNFKLPEWWKMNWFRFWLFCYGSISVIYTKKFGWVCQPYSVKRWDYQYNPRDIIVFNPYIQDKEIGGSIGLNAEIVHLFDDYFSIEPIIVRYAELLAQTERSLNINLMNSNISYLFEADGKKQADEIAESYGKATEGNPLILLNKKVMNGEALKPFLPNVKSNFIADTLLTVRRGIMNEFLTEIGIRNVSVQKKERLTQGETNENNDETKSIASVMFNNIKDGFERTNRISGLSLEVELAYDYEFIKGGGTHAVDTLGNN